MKSQAVLVGEAPRSKPDGGYCSISSLTVGLLWWAFAEGLLSLRGVRVGLALFELRIRRAAFVWTERKRGRGVPEFAAKYSASELASLCGLPEKRAKAALKELLDLGLVAEFSPATIRFARSFTELRLTEEQRSAFRSWFPLLTKRRYVPVPRRALVLACESSSKAQVATILGVCLRCSWLRPGEGFSFTGRVSCGWLARRFGVSPRAVQSAKEHLVGLGWLERTGNINRLGEVVAINPAWHRLLALPASEKSQDPGGEDETVPPPAGSNSAGVERPAGSNSAGVSLIPESPPPGEFKYQRRKSPEASAPEGPGPGISHPGPRENSKTQDPSAPKLPPPRLSAIRPEDFRDVGRALELFRQAVKCGLMPNASEHSRLLWLAAIERARTVSARNPAGVFLHVVKGRKWDYLSDGHHEAANRRLKAFLHSPPPDTVPFLVPRVAAPMRPPEPPGTRHSKDALLVQTLRQKLGEQGSVFAALHNHAGWNRERYSAALAELEAAPGKTPSPAANRV